MSTERPITVSLPLGLFSSVTVNVPAPTPHPAPPEAQAVSTAKKQDAPETPETPATSESPETPGPTLGASGLEDDIYWDDESA